ncbi:hypothetical protein DL95DRAFT_461511 [Leptodontidium sp. 2 PMI_412]|nr:hypothetical protein DL95DRAFT_461511 [Leptodontidium sp. 2 PMI_412]
MPRRAASVIFITAVFSTVMTSMFDYQESYFENVRSGLVACSMVVSHIFYTLYIQARCNLHRACHEVHFCNLLYTVSMPKRTSPQQETVSKDEGGCLKAAAYTITISQKPTASVASIDVTPLPSLPQTMLTDEQFEQPNRFDDHGQFPKNEKINTTPVNKANKLKTEPVIYTDGSVMFLKFPLAMTNNREHDCGKGYEDAAVSPAESMQSASSFNTDAIIEMFNLMKTTSIRALFDNLRADQIDSGMGNSLESGETVMHGGLTAWWKVDCWEKVAAIYHPISVMTCQVSRRGKIRPRESTLRVQCPLTR